MAFTASSILVPELTLGGLEIAEVGARAPERRSSGGTVRHRLLQRQRGRAEGALGRHPADDPMRPAAAGAMVDLAVMIDRMIAAGIRVERPAAALDRTQHGAFLRNHFTSQRAMSRSVSSMICLSPLHVTIAA